jgi:glycosyltransferase involved in cell wall biosynthesis
MGQPFDAVHVEHLRGAAAANLCAGLNCWTVFDAVDCIAELARLSAAHTDRMLVRLMSRVEEQRTRSLEQRLLLASDIVTVAAERDRRALAATEPVSISRLVTIPNGAQILPTLVALTDDPVVTFTGKLSYHANQTAVRHLCDEIWPLIQREVPSARLVIAGAHPPAWLRRLDNQHGISIVADPPDLLAVIAQARVAVAPMPYSVGIQNKVLEAMGCGVPVVASSQAMSGLLPEASNALLRATTPPEVAQAVIALLRPGSTAKELGARGHEYVRRHHSWSTVALRFEELYSRHEVRRMVA